jgi:hypothetical protein
VSPDDGYTHGQRTALLRWQPNPGNVPDLPVSVQMDDSQLILLPAVRTDYSDADSSQRPVARHEHLLSICPIQAI